MKDAMATIRRNKRSNNNHEIEENVQPYSQGEKKKLSFSIHHPKCYIFALVLISLTVFLQSKWNTTSNPVSIHGMGANKEEESPPLYFIMYVGPPKTGSTTLQCSLRYLQDEYLLPSNIYFMRKSFHIDGCGKHKFKTKQKDGPITNFMRDCLRRWEYGSGMPDCWQSNYKRYIQTQEQLNRSIFVIEETLSWVPELILDESNVNKTQNMVRAQQFLQDFVSSLDPRYHLIVVVAYRNYFDWIFSYYTQKAKRLIKKTNSWGINELTSPEKYVKENPVRNHYSDYVYDFFAQGAKSNPRISLKVMNMENTTDILQEFFCKLVPSSLNMCQFVNKASKLDVSNTSPNYLLCDKLATQAYKKGFLKHTTKSRYQVFSEIQEHVENKKKLSSCQALGPQICPSDSFYEDLLNQCIGLHMNIFHKNDVLDSSDNEDDQMVVLRNYYQKKLNKSKQKFCTINATAILLDKEWDVLLRSA